MPASLLVGGIGWVISDDPLCLFAALIGGWFIDLDHLFDFAYYFYRTRDWSACVLLKSGAYFKKNKKVLIPLHSWELVIGAMTVAVFFEITPVICATVAMAVHLLQDQHKYKVRPLGYFILSRIACRFEIKNFCKSKITS
mgnify:CR=1 FL=1